MTMSRAYQNIIVDDARGDVAVVTLNRPEVKNALNLAMVEELHDALGDLALRDGLAALIITGAGDQAFASGADISELLERTHRDALRAINSGLFRRIEEFPRPTIAAVRGYALGGGCELALACDLRVAGASSRFGQPEVGLGIMPAAGATYRLPRLVGLGRAKELIFTGDILDAREAERIGLVNRVVPDDAVLDAALETAKKIAAKSALAIHLAKVSMNAFARGANAFEIESVAQAVLFESEEKRRRMTAFLAKRGGKGGSKKAEKPERAD